MDSLLKGDNDIFLDNIFDNDDVFNDVFNDVLTQTSQSLNSYILVDFWTLDIYAVSWDSPKRHLTARLQYGDGG